jgi:hypothetical protein
MRKQGTVYRADNEWEGESDLVIAPMVGSRYIAVFVKKVVTSEGSGESRNR